MNAHACNRKKMVNKLRPMRRIVPPPFAILDSSICFVMIAYWIKAALNNSAGIECSVGPPAAAVRLLLLLLLLSHLPPLFLRAFVRLSLPFLILAGGGESSTINERNRYHISL